MDFTRRKFIKNALIGAGAANMVSNTFGRSVDQEFAQAAGHQVSANDKIQMAVIGCKGQGWANMNSLLKMPEVDCIALCDIDDSVLDERSNNVKSLRGNTPERYKDFRKLLENKDIDAVVIGAPDHWHCLMMSEACDAGKDVYVEKPLANTIEEVKLMQKTQKRYDKIVQVGQWQRSSSHMKDAVDYVQSGKLGKIRLVKVWAYMGWCKSIPVRPDEAVPAGVDYDMWLGPATKRPFNWNRFHFNFRWYWDYAGGLMTDWGVHLIDIALWGMNATAPKSIMASGGKFAYPDDAQETPDTLQAVYEYDDFTLLWEHAVGIDLGPYERTHGIAFIGNNGTLVVDRGGWEILPEPSQDIYQPYRPYKMESIPHQSSDGASFDKHTRNFIEAVKTRDSSKLKCPVDTAALSAINSHLGNIAFKTGRKVYWDHAKGSFTNDDQANKFLNANYQNGWQLPKV